MKTREEIVKARQNKGFCTCKKCIAEELTLQQSIASMVSGIQKKKEKKGRT